MKWQMCLKIKQNFYISNYLGVNLYIYKVIKLNIIFGSQIAKSGFRLPFSANALDITNDIINAKANLNPNAIRYPLPRKKRVVRV